MAEELTCIFDDLQECNGCMICTGSQELIDGGE